MIVVTGATGNVGRPLVRALAEAGEQVTAVARKQADVPAGVRFAQADLIEPGSLKPALDGASALFLLTSAEFLAGGDIREVVEVVRAAGVGRVVLLSSQGVGTGRHPAGLEDAVKGAGPEWTVLRPGNFDSNALQWAGSVRAHRTVAAPFGDVALPAVDPADIAEVAAAALREPGHGGRTYTLTGPVAVSPRQQAAVIGEVLGEPVRFVELSRAEARERMLAHMPEPVVEATLGILGEPSADERRVSPDVARVLGRPARAFAEWVARNRAAFG
ncbi:NAD(P)H-binding protein [Saccharothrix syringae]|uniref:NAD-dependent epimerase/dehydratase family protein n=1 Tax=Saccharothrix syringae TaxID=103733 RepID=A0A5Q0GZW9_SACSY|nr:NAD(P)H-binding protein [Saccharothrix syringae]QFZ18962.1 NAD-dependent epimerase/dehydratase family protein [Saccharothrix syringae]